MTKEVERLVDSYAIEPSGQFSFSLKGRKTLPCFEKRGLQYVVSILMCKDYTTNLPIQRLAVLVNNHGENLLSSFGTRQQANHFSFIEGSHYSSRKGF